MGNQHVNKILINHKKDLITEYDRQKNIEEYNKQIHLKLLNDINASKIFMNEKRKLAIEYFNEINKSYKTVIKKDKIPLWTNKDKKSTYKLYKFTNYLLYILTNSNLNKILNIKFEDSIVESNELCVIENSVSLDDKIKENILTELDSFYEEDFINYKFKEESINLNLTNDLFINESVEINKTKILQNDNTKNSAIKNKIKQLHKIKPVIIKVDLRKVNKKVKFRDISPITNKECKLLNKSSTCFKNIKTMTVKEFYNFINEK